MVQEPGLSGFHGKVAKAVDYAQLDFVCKSLFDGDGGEISDPLWDL